MPAPIAALLAATMAMVLCAGSGHAAVRHRGKQQHQPRHEAQVRCEFPIDYRAFFCAEPDALGDGE